jgi:hypothetical protein
MQSNTKQGELTVSRKVVVVSLVEYRSEACVCGLCAAAERDTEIRIMESTASQSACEYGQAAGQHHA